MRSMALPCIDLEKLSEFRLRMRQKIIVELIRRDRQCEDVTYNRVGQTGGVPRSLIVTHYPVCQTGADALTIAPKWHVN